MNRFCVYLVHKYVTDSVGKSENQMGGASCNSKPFERIVLVLFLPNHGERGGD